MMTTTLKKLSALMLALGMIFILNFPSLAHAADTGGSDHFELTVVENKDSKSGAEIADLTIKNISGKTGTNVTFEADLPTIFHDKDTKKVTVNVGTLKAGDAKTYQVSRKTDGTVTTTPLPTTGNLSTTGATNTATKTSTSLPSTGEKMTPVLMVLGLGVLAAVLIISIKHRKTARNVLALVLLIAGLGSAATVKAAEETYHHRDEVRNHAVELAGTTHVFHLAAEGDFEGDNGEPGVSNNFTITYYINGEKVTDLDPDGYTSGVKTIYLPRPTFEGYDFSGWYNNATFTGDAFTSFSKETTGHQVFYGKTVPHVYQVTFDLKGGAFPDATSTIQDVEHGAIVSEPTAPEKDDEIVGVSTTGPIPEHDFIFRGWYIDPELTTAFDFNTPITGNITLYAKWGLPVTEAGTNNDLGTKYGNNTLGDQGDTVWVANSWWQIIDDDMDNNVTNGLQALVLKMEALTSDEATGDSGMATYISHFKDDTTNPDNYFNSDGTNSYELAVGTGLRGAIDHYYMSTVAANYTDHVQAVNLHNPTLAEYNAANNLTWGYNGGGASWLNSYMDDHFATELEVTGTKQAFALSYGDIHVHMGMPVSSTDKISDLLNFSSSSDNQFWLRSVAVNYIGVGVVKAGDISYRNSVYSGTQPVRPALALLIN